MLDAISPLDGRYRTRLEALRPYLSEWALFKHRVRIEVAWLLFLASSDAVPEVPEFGEEDVVGLQALYQDFADDDAAAIKAIEADTNHDVKAVEYFVKDRVDALGLGQVREFVHFACTSADINNLAYALMLKGAVQDVWLPAAESLVDDVAALARQERETAMLAHTHGQPASPTTLGKELANFVYRWRRQLAAIRQQEYLGKFNGAVGNFNAHTAAYPAVPWPALAHTFVQSLGLTYNPLTTQIEPHDYLAELFQALSRFNTILLDFARDMWLYIALDYFGQQLVGGEVGSSTMPHKVNPIDFENGEANAGVSTAMLTHLSQKLPASRLQRDLSDSSAQRNTGVGVAYSLLAIQSVHKGLAKVRANTQAMQRDLDARWEVLAEAVQTVMRKTGHHKPYETLKTLTRGAEITAADIKDFIASLELPPQERQRLAAMSPADYTGLAARLVAEWLGEDGSGT